MTKSQTHPQRSKYHSYQYFLSLSLLSSIFAPSYALTLFQANMTEVILAKIVNSHKETAQANSQNTQLFDLYLFYFP